MIFFGFRIGMAEKNNPDFFPLTTFLFYNIEYPLNYFFTFKDFLLINDILFLPKF